MKTIMAGMLAAAALAGAACSDQSTDPAAPSYSAFGSSLASTAGGRAREGFGFNGTGAEAGKPAVTGAGIVVLLADFYRAGDGNDESFTAQMIVADHDIAPDILGEQTLWVQGVGCGDAVVHFNR